MKISSIQPAGSYSRPAEIFPDNLPQVAFSGRSNVGKSALINKLLGRRKIAPISSTPGKTRKIHFFEINGSFYLVDLPGYGYARLPLDVKEKWRQNIENYLEKSSQLQGVVCLLDIRRTPNELDRQMLVYLAGKKIPVLVALTKADKLNRSARQKALQNILDSLAGSVAEDQVVLTSARTGEGCRELLAAVGSLTGCENETTDENNSDTEH